MLHFELGQFKEALGEFEQAYKLSPHPLLLFNIAQAERLAGERDRALATYTAYLQAVPDAPNRSDVEAFVAELSRPAEPVRLERPVDRQPDAATRAIYVKTPQPVYKKWWLWTSVGVVVVGAVVVGAVVGTRPHDPSLGVVDARH